MSEVLLSVSPGINCAADVCNYRGAWRQCKRVAAWRVDVRGVAVNLCGRHRVSYAPKAGAVKLYVVSL